MSARSTWHLDLMALLFLCACALIFHGAGLLGGPVYWERDTTLFYYPLTDVLAEQLRAGRLPLWVQTIFAGYPLLADGEVGPLYPLNLLVLPWAPVSIAFVGLRALHTTIAATLCYGLLRCLGSSRAGGMMSGLIFGFGSFLVGQLQHENMIRSAVWLPGELMLVELGIRSSGWARQRWLAAAGALTGVACLGVHIQAVAMSTIALVTYIPARLIVGPFLGTWRQRLLLALWAPAIVLGVALGLAAAQWLPLFELGRTSFRGPGLRYDLATTYSLAPANLLSLIFPYFFRTSDSFWWSLWSPWETLPYAGVAPLFLAALGFTQFRRRVIWYFALLAGFGLWLAMAHYAPLNLHEAFSRLPGFSSLRAPGRFTYLFILGIAGLAAFGIDGLLGHLKGKPWKVTVVGATALMLSVGLAWLSQAVLQRMLADPVRFWKLLEEHYLSLRRERAELDVQQVYGGALASLDLSNQKTAFGLALLFGTGVLLLACARWPRRARLWTGALIALTTVDLLVFAMDYHPATPLQTSMAMPRVAETLARQGLDEHVFAEPVLQELEPNRLALSRVWDLNGYSSLQSQRHSEYISSVDTQDNALFDMWNGRYYVVPARRNDVVVANGTAFRPYEALMSGGHGNPTGRERFRIEPFTSAEARVLGALTNAASLPQGTPVAEITLQAATGERRSLLLRAGVEVSEHAIDRSDVTPISRHERARVIYGLRDFAPPNLPFISNVYEATFQLNPPLAVELIEARYLASEGYLRLWGLGLVEPETNRVRSLFADDKTKYEHPPLYADERAVVYRNEAAFPRAFIVPEALPRRTRTEQTAIARLALQPFDPRRQTVLEEGPFDEVPLAAEILADSGSDQPPPAAAITTISPESLLISATGPGVLVLTDAYHRGWRAYIGGREVPVYIANFIGRGVALPPGENTVEMVFDPLSWRFGRVVSLTAVLFVLTVLASGFYAKVRAL